LITSDFGGGAIRGGQFEDVDFASSGRQGLFSDSISPVTGDALYYFTIDGGLRIIDRKSFTWDLVLGYQYWRAKYVATGGRFLVPPGDPDLPAGTVALTDAYRWRGFRVGGQCALELLPRVWLKSRVILLPVLNLEVQNTHPLRPAEFKQDPSV